MADNKQHRYNNPFTATLTGIRDLFRRQTPAGTLKPTDRLEGKTVLVDGASSGLGFAIAVEVARRGARLIMACRSGIPEKGEKVKKLSGNPDVHMLPVDFSDLRSIRELIAKLRSFSISGEGRRAGIDIYICNAGIVPRQSRKTAQGLEEMFMVNYFSKFVFIKLLLENRCFNSPHPEDRHASRLTPHASPVTPHESIPRLILIASESHRNPEKFDWENFGRYREYSIGKSIELYGYYKLLLTTFAVELSRRLNPDRATKHSVFALCPGPVNSNIAREAPKVFIPLLKLVFGIFFRSPAQAAVPAVYLAASEDVEGKVFDYLFLMSRKEVDEKASDPANGRQLWELSDQLMKTLETE